MNTSNVNVSVIVGVIVVIGLLTALVLMFRKNLLAKTKSMSVGDADKTWGCQYLTPNDPTSPLTSQCIQYPVGSPLAQYSSQLECLQKFQCLSGECYQCDPTSHTCKVTGRETDPDYAGCETGIYGSYTAGQWDQCNNGCLLPTWGCSHVNHDPTQPYAGGCSQYPVGNPEAKFTTVHDCLYSGQCTDPPIKECYTCDPETLTCKFKCADNAPCDCSGPEDTHGSLTDGGWGECNALCGLRHRMDRILTRISPDDPAYALCTAGNPNQICYYNHAPGSPTIPSMPSISTDPNIWLGFSIPNVTLPSSSTGGFQTTQTAYLGTPTDLLQTNNIQMSQHSDSQCGGTGQAPDTCNANPNHYCPCPGSAETVCGLACAPGLIAKKLGDCSPNGTGMYIQNWQCIEPLIVGIKDKDTGKHMCKMVTEKTPPPGSTVYASMKACKEEYEDCEKGFTRFGIKGCFRNDFNREWTCEGAFSCGSGAGECQTYGWLSRCHGTAFSCNSDCVNATNTPPWSYECITYDAKNPHWKQCVSDSPCPPIDPSGGSAFNIHDDYYCDASTPIIQ